MSQFAAVLSTVFSGEVMLAIAIGTLAGMVIGAMPGLSATMGVALLTPLTYTLSPSAAISMLAAVYTSAIYGGSITACLLHTPGTPASAATAADGYALTKQGQGMKAIGISTVCSMIGGTISAIALLLISEPLSRISLMFTPAEYMLLGLFGLTIIGSLSGDNLLKGLIAGAVGLVIACIGLDGMSGVPRYVFGITRLESGISMVPAMIGMFSISQAMIITEDLFKGKSLIVDDPSSTLKGRVLPTAKEMKRITPTVIKSTIIGIFVGILPAAGGDIGSWVGYNNAKKSSKHPEEFGHGSIEGIAASETANNAVTGGALIPLLTLGIPGSGTAAIMLGSLMIHGMQPGPELFTKQAVQTHGHSRPADFQVCRPRGARTDVHSLPGDRCPFHDRLLRYQQQHFRCLCHGVFRAARLSFPKGEYRFGSGHSGRNTKLHGREKLPANAHSQPRRCTPLYFLPPDRHRPDRHDPSRRFLPVPC